MPSDARAAASRLFDDAEREHGDLLVRATCGLLCAARDGLSISELLHMLSADNDVLTSLLKHAPRAPNLPRISPARLQLLLRTQLEPMLCESLAAAHGGAALLRWRHELLRRIAIERYAPDGCWHRSLADFFSGVSPPPLPPITRSGSVVTLPPDRGLPVQPLMLACDGGRAMWYNRRAMRELPAALLGCGAFAELADALISLPWISAKLEALGMHELLDDFATVLEASAAHQATRMPPSEAADSEDAQAEGSGDDQSEDPLIELCALGEVFRRCARPIEDDPLQLEAQLLSRLPHVLLASSQGSPLLEGLQLQLELSIERRAKQKGVTLRPIWPCLPAAAPSSLKHVYRGHIRSADDALAGGDNVTAVGVDVKGRTAISIADGVLQRWDVVHGHKLGGEVAHGHECEISALALDIDGSVALLGGVDGSVSVWTTESAVSTDGNLRRQQRLCLPPPKASADNRRVCALALTEVGVGLALRADGSCCSWAWAGGASTLRQLSERLRIGEHSSSALTSSPIVAAAIGHDGGAGPTIALAAAEKSTRVHAFQLHVNARGSQQPSLVYRGHMQPIAAVALRSGADESAGAHEMAVSAGGGHIHLWRVRDGVPMARLLPDDGPDLSSLALRGSHLISGSVVGVLGLFAVTDPEVVATDATSEGPKTAPKISASSKPMSAMGTDAAKAAARRSLTPATPTVASSDASEMVTAQQRAQEAQEAAMALQQQFEQLNRGAAAAQAERVLQSKKTTESSSRVQPTGAPSPPQPSAILDDSWGMDTPAQSPRQQLDSELETSDDSEEEEMQLLAPMVMTPLLGSPLATERSEFESPSHDVPSPAPAPPRDTPSRGGVIQVI
jgi:WD40 repeat protein